MNDLIELNALIREREKQGKGVRRLERKYFKLLGYDLQRSNRQRV